VRILPPAHESVFNSTNPLEVFIMLGVNLERVIFASDKDSICAVSSTMGDIALYIREDIDKALVREFLEGIRCMDPADFERMMVMLK
jgi:restriction endonuclease Mrr